MKRLLLITLLFVLYLPLTGQEREEETLISGDIKSGWAVGSYVGLTMFNGQSTITDGFRAEWILNKKWREDYFYAAQASAFVEINVVSWFRIMTSAGYRIVQSVDRQGLANSDISGLSGGITFRFGNFR